MLIVNGKPRSTHKAFFGASCAKIFGSCFLHKQHFQAKRVTVIIKNLIRRWDSERKLSLQWHRTRTIQIDAVGTHVYHIQWNNAM